MVVGGGGRGAGCNKQPTGFEITSTTVQIILVCLLLQITGTAVVELGGLQLGANAAKDQQQQQQQQ